MTSKKSLKDIEQETLSDEEKGGVKEDADKRKEHPVGEENPSQLDREKNMDYEKPDK